MTLPMRPNFPTFTPLEHHLQNFTPILFAVLASCSVVVPLCRFFCVTRNERCQRKDCARANELELSGEEKVQAHFQCERVKKQHAQNCERMLSCALSRMGRQTTVPVRAPTSETPPHCWGRCHERSTDFLM